MRIIRRLLTLALAAGASLVPASAHAAADRSYPIPSPSLTAHPSTVSVDDTIEVTGANYGSNETVSLDVTYSSAAVRPAGGVMVPFAHTVPLRAPVRTVVADGNGDFTVALRLVQFDVAHITGSGLSTSRTASTWVRVLPAGSSLPITGDGGHLGMLLIGSAVAAAGILLVVFTRPRRRPIRIRS